MLERHRDGESIPELRAAVEAHLKSCERCRQYLAIRAAPGSIQEEMEPPAGLPGLLNRLRQWEAALPAPEVRGGAIRNRAAQEISLYLGANAARQITQAVRDDAGNLLPAIQPFLGRFLGRKAASHLSSRIVDVAVVRI